MNYPLACRAVFTESVVSLAITTSDELLVNVLLHHLQVCLPAIMVYNF